MSERYLHVERSGYSAPGPHDVDMSDGWRQRAERAEAALADLKVKSNEAIQAAAVLVEQQARAAGRMEAERDKLRADLAQAHKAGLEMATKGDAEIKRLTEALEFTTFNADDNTERLIARIVELEAERDQLQRERGLLGDACERLRKALSDAQRLRR